MNFVSAPGSLRQSVASLLLAVFVCLGLVPVGFMPGVSGGGSILQLCSGVEQRTITTDPQGQPVHKTVEIPCAFALNASTAPTVQPVLLAPPVFDTPIFALTPSVAVAQNRVPSHAPRAPPVTL